MEEDYIFEDYFFEIWENKIPLSVVSNEYYNKNLDLINEITFQFYERFSNLGFPSTEQAATALITVFSTIQKVGLR